MLAPFDWLRRSDTGAELLATLGCLTEEPELLATPLSLGAPLAALGGPCRRCWIYARGSGNPYCKVCRTILQRRRKLAPRAHRAVVIWGNVEPFPVSLRRWPDEVDARLLGTYVRDARHFLLMMRRTAIKPWLQELVVRQGTALQGLLQILPTVGARSTPGMGDLLCRAMAHESHLPMDRMRVRFYTTPAQVIAPRERDREGILTFEIADFLRLLEMAEVFRALLHPEEQRELFELLRLEDGQEASFFWGRFLGRLNPQTRDMLSAWGIRSWPRSRIRLLSELIDYVALPSRA